MGWGGGKIKCQQTGVMADLQISVVVLTEQLHEAQDWLHDGDDDTHLAFLLALISGRDGSAISGRLVLFGLGLAAVGCEGLLGDSGSLH